MATKALVVAALAVWSWIAPLPAQSRESVDAQLAKAVLLESQGDTAGAEEVLRLTIAAAEAKQRPQAEAALRGLLQRLGRGEDATAKAVTAQDPVTVRAPAAGDPIQRLLAALDEGSTNVKSVDEAYGQLQSLGALVVPHLLAALPKFGPFGLRNAVSLLRSFDDPRIVPALRARIANDDAVAAMLAEELGARAPWTMAFARELAGRPLPPKARFEVLQVLRGSGADEREWRPLLDALLGVPEVHDELLESVSKEGKGAYDEIVLKALQQQGNDYVRAAATLRLLLADPRLDEATALAAFAKPPALHVTWMAKQLVERNPSWAGVGVLALRGNDTDGLPEQHWFTRTEWWRRPAEAAPALLRVRVRPGHSHDAIVRSLKAIADTGWRVPRDLEMEFVKRMSEANTQEAMHCLVSVLPDDDEARALAVWASLSPNARRGFVGATVNAGRPWHRVVVGQIAQAKKSTEIDGDWLARDWRGAPAEVLAQLTETVARFAMKDGASSPPWQGQLVTAYSSGQGVPVAVIATLVRAGSVSATQVMCARDPGEALAEALRLPNPRNEQLHALSALLPRHGDRRHLAVAVDWYSRQGDPNGSLQRFFSEHGIGAPEVIALAKTADNGRLAFMERVARGARVEDLATLLAMFPDLPSDTVQHVVGALEPQVRREHAPALRSALAALVTKWPLPVREGRVAGDELLIHLSNLLGRVGSQEDLPTLRAAWSLDTTWSGAAARAAVEVAGPQRRQVLVELLKSPRAAVVEAAFVADLRGDVELCEMAMQAVLRYGKQAASNAIVPHLGPEQGVALAKRVLGDEQLSAFVEGLVNNSLNALVRDKDARHVADLARAIAHPAVSVRKNAALCLGNTFSREAAPYLLQLAKDSSPPVRKQAEESLEQIANYLDTAAKWAERLK